MAEKFLEEAYIMQQFDHQHIIKLIGREAEKKDLYRRLGQRSSLLLGGTELIQFLAALAVLHHDDVKKRMNCTRMI